MALWTRPTPLPSTQRPSQGLAQPDSISWNAYLPSIDNSAAVRIVPRKADPAVIESTSLWQPPSKTTPRQDQLESAQQDGLWKPAMKPQSAQTGLWTLPPVVEVVSFGLLQPHHDEWKAYLPTNDEDVRVKPREATPAIIKSTTLWTRQPKVVKEMSAGPALWIEHQPKPAVNFGLWTKAPAAVTKDNGKDNGLFSTQTGRTDFRFTTLPPAGLGMVRKPRAQEEAFPRIVFARLWSQSSLWCAHTTQARLAAIVAADAHDAATEGLFSLNRLRTNLRTTSELPVGLDTDIHMTNKGPGKGRSTDSALPLLDSDSLWSVREAVSMANQARTKAARNWLLISASGAGSLRRPSSVAATEWKAALDEAVRACLIAQDKDQGQDQDMLDRRESVSSTVSTASTTSSNWSRYQLWSGPESIPEDIKTSGSSTSSSMWQPSAYMASNVPSARPSIITAPRDDHHRRRRSSASSARRGRRMSTHRPMASVYLAALDDESSVPRDLPSQTMWTRIEESAVDDRSWLDESLQKNAPLIKGF